MDNGQIHRQQCFAGQALGTELRWGRVQVHGSDDSADLLGSVVGTLQQIDRGDYPESLIGLNSVDFIN